MARDAGRATGPAVERKPSEDFQRFVASDYQLNERSSEKKIKQTPRHLLEIFAGTAAQTIVERRITDYGAQPQTIVVAKA